MLHCNACGLEGGKSVCEIILLDPAEGVSMQMYAQTCISARTSGSLSLDLLLSSRSTAGCAAADGSWTCGMLMVKARC